MFLAEENLYAPNCECFGIIDNSDDFTEKDNLILQKWNGAVMREYRKSIIGHKEKIVCNEICNKNINTRRYILF